MSQNRVENGPKSMHYGIPGFIRDFRSKPAGQPGLGAVQGPSRGACAVEASVVSKGDFFSKQLFVAVHMSPLDPKLREIFEFQHESSRK